MGTRIALFRPGLLPYQDGLVLQQRLAERVREGGEETLVLLEHPHTYTLGVRGKEQHLLLNAEGFRARGATVVRTDRGGDVTYHGPGQVVGYPIMNIRARGLGPAEYVRLLEQVLIDALSSFRIAASRIAGRPGVWTGGEKIAAVGVRVSRGVTTHGFALNVNTDLTRFDDIVPCGIVDAGVTSIERLRGAQTAMVEVQRALVSAFALTFGSELVEVDHEGLSIQLGREEALVGR